MFFSYWIRNELAERFNLVPDVGYLPTDDLDESGNDAEDDQEGDHAATTVVVGLKSPTRRQIGRVVSRDPPKKSEHPPFFSRDGLRSRVDKIRELAKRKASAASREAERKLRAQTKRNSRRGAEFCHTTVLSALCFPCALCQTHRELELRGFQPVRYLSATKIAAASFAGGVVNDRMH